MIYDYGSHFDIYTYLRENLPSNSIVKIATGRKLEQITKEGDLVIFYGWGKGNRKTQRILLDKGVRVVVDGETSLKLGDKIKQLKVVDTISQFPLERNYIENATRELKTYRVPFLVNSERVVLKIGNAHQGKDKYLKRPQEIVRTRDNVIFEEYIDKARSLRVLFIGNKLWVVEHIDNGWIKNNNPTEIVYPYGSLDNIGLYNINDIVKDAIKLKEFYNMTYAGIDYVVSEKKTGILEVNDMIGLPEDEEIRKVAKDYWYNLCKEHKERW